MTFENAFTMHTSSIKYGPAVTREVGHDMKELGTRRVMVVTDPDMTKSQSVSVTLEALCNESVDAVLFDRVSVEPTDVSFMEAIQFAKDGKFDGYVAVGGGSSMDTAKAANLYATYPADLLTYVNAPIGQGRPVPGRLKPMIAVPTTAGTGSETTGVAIFDFLEMHAKTGIAHRALRPVMGIVDPDNTRTLPRMVAACTGILMEELKTQNMTTNYQDRLRIPLACNDYTRFETSTGLHVATGYTRVVIGGRGPYIEFLPGHLIGDSLQMPDEEKYRLEHAWKEKVFYVEWRTKDQSNVKVYDQKRTVDYADYKVGLFYISPFDLFVEGELVITKLEKTKSRSPSE